MEQTYYILILSAVIGYFCGTIPFGLILTKISGLGDIRQIGSGNIGATNVLRTGNKKIAAATLLADGLKGALPVIILNLYASQEAAALAAIGAFLGHVFPVWLKFKGGKGIAVFIGVLFALYWPSGVVFILTWIVTAYLFKMSSLSALVACLATPCFLFVTGQNQLAGVALALTIIAFWAHRENIDRIRKGTEPKIGKQ